ncbi:glyoxylase-like metal-dependent hydrolase (beta-lactamase superfamily II) [Thermocatellispora tengchongensis]|uniref:Glyoxylase-like metal-dependent hydrolase (Beta-lactamase superfamily II) n=1 Tax=Thermocatellispora tengchongensis TaxID=1073253 RepID=A0A840PG57_9ACTN|nr:MBL fold metallo-hydrolase [Thermocatellispora tengchongensis]MBB5136127.1 glyoxylase-like metal-dependent hydrolase (beta-lactamase superfamily II) [Thermocatellispora tengchongensis]
MPTPTWIAGDLVIQRIDETELPPQTGPWLLPDATPDVVTGEPWLRPDFADADGVLRLTTHSFAVTAGGLRVLVDTGIGNGKTRANPAWHDLDTPYLSRLAAAGHAPEDIDLVVLTHLHTDHVGWNTRADGTGWTPTFPNARYVTARAEWDYWASADLDEPRRAMFRDSVHPIRDAGLLDLADVPPQGVELAPGVRLLPTPGHTPGHVAVALGDGAAVITGDCVHHPVQLRHPAITSCVDIDPRQAVESRRRLLASLAGTGTLLLGSHFPAPTGGLVERDGESFRLVPGDDHHVAFIVSRPVGEAAV